MGKPIAAAFSCVNNDSHSDNFRPRYVETLIQYFDLIAYVRPIVNWKELRFVGGSESGGLFR